MSLIKTRAFEAEYETKLLSCACVLMLVSIASAQRLPGIAVPDSYKVTFTPDFTKDNFWCIPVNRVGVLKRVGIQGLGRISLGQCAVRPQLYAQAFISKGMEDSRNNWTPGYPGD